MTPLRDDQITLFCEDVAGGRTQRLLGKVVQELTGTLPFAEIVRVVGVLNKSDVQVRTKFARMEAETPLRVFGVRDRDFLPRALVDLNRQRSFASRPVESLPWPLPRYSIESYLIDDDVLAAAKLDETPETLRTTIDQSAESRRWLDVARGTLERVAFEFRKVRPASPDSRPADRAEALKVVVDRAGRMKGELTADEDLLAFLDDLAGDMEADGPLRFRVDGRELVYDVERALGASKGSLLAKLTQIAERSPPAALVTDVSAALQAMPESWRVVSG